MATLTIPQLARTKADPSHLMTVSAFSWLAANTDARARYHRTLRDNINRYGDVPIGMHVSGCYNPQWPELVKSQMREYCRLMIECEDRAYECWRKAGRRRATLRPFVEASRVAPAPVEWDRSANETAATL